MEIWKDIKGFDGYQISSEGRVRSFNKTTSNKRYSERHWKNRIIKQKVSKLDGRARVILWADNKEFTRLVHRLQAVAFLGEPKSDDMTVNHKDGNPLNNTIENLEWVSRTENIRYGFEHGQYPQVACLLVAEDGTEHRFRSLAQASRFLGKQSGYVSDRIKKGVCTFSGNGCNYSFFKGKGVI